MRPQGFAGIATTVGLHQRKDGGSSPGLARAHLEAHEGPQNLLRGTTRGTASTHHLAQRVRVGEIGQRRAGRDDLDPALDEGKHGLQTGECAALVRRRRQRKHAAAERRLHRRRVRGVNRAGGLGDCLRIDRDLRGVALDRAHEVALQPRHGREETSVGCFSDSEELTNLVEGNVEPLGELGDVVGQERRVRGVRQGNARVVGAEGLACQGCQHTRDLRGEHHRGEAWHHLLRLAQHCSHAVGQRRGILEAALSKLLRQSR